MVGQRFNEKMAAKAEVDSKQLKVMSEKIKARLEDAQALIDEAEKHTKKTSEQIKAIATEREKQFQA